MQERVDHRLQPTALAHEACLQFVAARVNWQGHRHAFATAAKAMRRIQVDSARRKLTFGRGGDWRQ